MKSIVYIILGGLVAIFVGALLVTATVWPVINVVETGKTPQYPETQPQYYSTEPRRVFDEALAGIEAMERWTLTSAVESTLVIEAERSGRLGFVDDVRIEVGPVTEFVTQVNVRSASRFGKGDFGQNARNIEVFFTELDDRLGALKFDPRKFEGEDEEETPEP
ncbi:MAG: DUF1499 domain-containing protein [Bradymonadaceae bacterium]